MAKSKQKTEGSAAPKGIGRLSIGIERAENGAIVRVGAEGEGKNSTYTSRTFIAPNGRTALRIATAHMQRMDTKHKKTKEKGKRRATKRQE
jgi:hypothetical protein